MNDGINNFLSDILANNFNVYKEKNLFAKNVKALNV